MKRILSITIAFAAFIFGANIAYSQSPVRPPVDFYSLSFKTIDGADFKFDQLKNKKVLIVNTASKCGYTPQYKDLEELNKLYKGQLVVIGFPSNDFGAQEPGSNSEIKSFCEATYGVTFLLMEKSVVKGAQKNNVFKWLTEKSRNGWNEVEPSWNFNKYLIDEQGRLIAHWPSKITPTSNEIVSKLK
jgi:Glutathione peroxidase